MHPFQKTASYAFNGWDFSKKKTILQNKDKSWFMDWVAYLQPQRLSVSAKNVEYQVFLLSQFWFRGMEPRSGRTLISHLFRLGVINYIGELSKTHQIHNPLEPWSSIDWGFLTKPFDVLVNTLKSDAKYKSICFIELSLNQLCKNSLNADHIFLMEILVKRIHPIPRCWTLRDWFRSRNQFRPIPGITSLQFHLFPESVSIPFNSALSQFPEFLHTGILRNSV